MATFRVAGKSEYLAVSGWGVDDVKLAKKAWVWLGQRCKTLDVAPAGYELEAQGVTSESFPVVLRVVYTVGPRIDDKQKLGEDPLLLYAKLVAPGKKKDDRSRRVKELVQGALDRHVGALAAGMTAEQILGEGWFAEDVLERVQLDLGKFGLRVYSASVKWLRVRRPASKYLSDVYKMRQLGAALKLAKQVGEWNAKLRLAQLEELVEEIISDKRAHNERLKELASDLLELLALKMKSDPEGDRRLSEELKEIVAGDQLRAFTDYLENRNELKADTEGVVDRARHEVLPPACVGGQGQLLPTERNDN